MIFSGEIKSKIKSIEMFFKTFFLYINTDIVSGDKN